MKLCRKRLHYYDSTLHGRCQECQKAGHSRRRNEDIEKTRKSESLRRSIWRKNNPDKDQKTRISYLPKRRKWENNRRKADVQYRIKVNLRSRIRSRILRAHTIGFKAGSAVKDIGCSMADLKEYLESRFQPGMTWDNYGNGKDQWCIDHIVPLASVDLTNRENFLKVCNYKNLQPLWFKDHIIKTKNERDLYLKTRRKKN
jgi:hypothetical protein